MKVFVQIGDGKKFIGTPYDIHQMINKFREQTHMYTKSRLEYKQDAPACKSILFVLEMDPSNFYNFNQAIITLYWSLPISIDYIDSEITVVREDGQ